MKRATQRALVNGGIAVAVVGIIVLVTLNFLESYTTRRLEEARAENQAMARQVAGQISALIEPYWQRLATLSEDAGLTEALTAEDSAAIEAFVAGNQPGFERVLRLRVVPAEQSEPQPDADPPLGYSSLDMLSRARSSRQPVEAELHMLDTESQHVVLVQPVLTGEEQFIGSLHLSLSSDVVAAARDILRRSPAYAELRQRIGGTAAQTLAESSGRRGDADPVTSAVNGTRWSVTLYPEPVNVLPGLDRALYLPIGIAGIAILAMVVALLTLSRRRSLPALEDHAIEYQGAIRTVLDGAHPELAALLPGGAGVSMRSAMSEASKATVEADVSATMQFDVATLDGSVPVEVPDRPPSKTGIEVTETSAEEEIPASIFRNYDIRGIVGETLTEDGVFQIGQALGTIAREKNQQTIIVARDGRHSSKALQDSLVAGLRSTGRDVLDIGLSPTPVLYFATHYLDARSGVMITGSHNPSNYNGLKIVLDGETLSGDAIKAIRKRVQSRDFATGQGGLEAAEIIPDYIRRISEDIPVMLSKPLVVVVDCGNGVPGIVAPHLLRAIGHDVIELFCEVDGDFPNHHPDPSQPENLKALIEAVRDEGADIGLAFDGDGDRLGVVDANGNIIWPDQQLMLFARDVLSRNPGARIIYDVKCSGRLTDVIREAGGEPVMYKTGHSLIKSKMKTTGALLAGEMSGHLFFKERWYGFDDALYAAARLLEILVKEGRPAAQVFSELPTGVSTPELRIDMAEESHAEFMKQVVAAADFGDAAITDIDGLRVDFSDSWGLIRPSNTTPCLVLRFEGDDAAALKRVQDAFRQLLLGIDADLKLPF